MLLIRDGYSGEMRQWIAGILLVAAAVAVAAHAQERPAISPQMSFFITSTGRGFGANLGGLAGADAHCARLAAAAGASQRTWRAYLSAPATARGPAVHARDRIGKGPWRNAAGVEIASDLAHLHGEDNLIDLETALTEKGNRVDGSRHDILTGSNPDGTLALDRFDTTCNGWTSHDNGRAMVGHHNRSGGGQRGTSWNSAHPSRGCSQRALRASVGDGLIYCFAAD
jgi:hypothetical protein